MVQKLAVEGGTPVRSSLLPYGQQWIDDKDIEAVIQVLRGDFITQGPMIAEFERKVAQYVGAKYAVAFSSGTAALHGACFAAGIGKGDEVITTPITFVASSNCVLYCGGTPVFADIRPDTCNIDVDEIEKKLTSRTKAIIPVDYTGHPTEIDRIMSLAKETAKAKCGRELVVIQDAAHSLGASYKSVKVGAWADMTMFSFHPVKHVTTAEGGMIVTNNEAFYEKMVLFRTHGITKEKHLLQNNPHGDWYYEMQELGYHYRITDLQAALGVSQLERLDSFVDRRRQLVDRYQEAFSTMDGLITPTELEQCRSAWHLYVLRFKQDKFRVSRREIFQALRAENIGVNVHYIPVYWQPYYESLGYSKGVCPIAEHIYEEMVTLPLFPKMTENDIEDVIAAVNKVYKAYIE